MKRTKGKLVRATCQFPPEYPGDGPHTFEYVKVTKPQAYCEPHRKGWVDDDGRKHGDERRVRVIREQVPVFAEDGRTIAGWTEGAVIGRRLIAEDSLPDSEVVKQLRRAGAQWLQALGLPMLGDLQPDPITPAPGVHGDPFQWVVVELVEDGGVQVKVEAIVTDAQGRPRFDPKLFRALKVEDTYEVRPDPDAEPPSDSYPDGEDVELSLRQQYGPEGALGDPDEVKGVGGSREPRALPWDVAATLADPEPAPGVIPAPDPLATHNRWPEALRRFEVAITAVILRGRGARWYEKERAAEAQRLFPEEYELAASLARQRLLQLNEELSEDMPPDVRDALLAALLRGSPGETPVLSSEGGKSRPRSKGNTRKVNRP